MTPTYALLVSLIGESASAMLCERLGGAPLYIPRYPCRHSPLVLAVGHGAAARLSDRYGGGYLCLPSQTALAAARRRESVLYELRRGQPLADIARRHGLSTRQIINIRRAAQESA